MELMESNRRRYGRPRNPNSPPSNAHLATRKEVLDELDRLVNYSRMPLGKKLESLIAEVKMHRKNLVGQRQTSQPSHQRQQQAEVRNTNNIDNLLNESFLDLEEQWTEEESQILVDSGWNRHP